jgi:hypothetical protein
MRQDSAPQIPTKLLLDVARQILASLLAHRREEGLEVLAHDEMKHRGFGAMALVGP